LSYGCMLQRCGSGPSNGPEQQQGDYYAPWASAGKKIARRDRLIGNCWTAAWKCVISPPRS